MVKSAQEVWRRNLKVYKIRDLKTGLFSSGGSYPTWSKNGKIWTTLGKCKSHLSMFKSDWGAKLGFPSPFWEVVEFELVETGDNCTAAALMNCTSKKKS